MTQLLLDSHCALTQQMSGSSHVMYGAILRGARPLKAKRSSTRSSSAVARVGEDKGIGALGLAGCTVARDGDSTENSGGHGEVEDVGSYGATHGHESIGLGATIGALGTERA
ncbi:MULTISPECIES: hypothetical protein [unclassified Streptomyces]|uniref:hypothetical protein n=1 Tax=unclassified Streptomyces TaxID=2593676 RepID=UPI003824B846